MPDKVTMVTHIKISSDGGSFGAYLALPETTPAPAVICIQEVYGVNRFIRAAEHIAGFARRGEI